MYAIIKVGGHQYKVSPGETLTVDLLDKQTGEKVEFPALLVVDDKRNVKVGKEASITKVTAKITGVSQGQKIHVRRFRNKSRHHRHIGFRAQLTSLVVESIGTTKAPQKASKKKVE